MDLPRRASLLLPLSLWGCSQGRAPRSAAEAFIDRYYVERDHAKALEVAAEGAAERVRSEQRLLAGGGGGRGPRVYYNLEKEQPRDEAVELTYLLRIDAGGMKLKKQVVLRVRKLGEEFKVVALVEADLPTE